jgi:hypothetical protein
MGKIHTITKDVTVDTTVDVDIDLDDFDDDELIHELEERAYKVLYKDEYLGKDELITLTNMLENARLGSDEWKIREKLYGLLRA